MSEYNFNDYQQDTLTKPRDKAWDNWAKFEKIGDMVQGFIRDVFFRQGEGQFADQRGLTLEQPDGTLINVGIKHIDFVLAKTDNLRLNDPLTVVFEKEIPAQVKGHSATKQFAFYGKTLPENVNEKSVAVLEAEDRKLAASEAAAKAEEEAAAQAAFDGQPVGVETAPANNAPSSDLPFESNAAQPTTTAAPVAAPVAPAPVAPATPVAPVAAAPVAPNAAQ